MSDPDLERSLRIRLEGQLEVLEESERGCGEVRALLESSQWRVEPEIEDRLRRLAELLPEAARAKAAVEKQRTRSTPAEWSILEGHLERNVRAERALSEAAGGVLRANQQELVGLLAQVEGLRHLSRPAPLEADERVILKTDANLYALDQRGEPILLGSEVGTGFFSFRKGANAGDFRGRLTLTQRRVLYADPVRVFTFEIAATELRFICRVESEPPYDLAHLGGFKLSMPDSSPLAWRWPPLKVFGWQEVYDAWAAADFPAKWPREDSE